MDSKECFLLSDPVQIDYYANNTMKEISIICAKNCAKETFSQVIWCTFKVPFSDSNLAQGIYLAHLFSLTKILISFEIIIHFYILVQSAIALSQNVFWQVLVKNLLWVNKTISSMSSYWAGLLIFYGCYKDISINIRKSKMQFLHKTGKTLFWDEAGLRQLYDHILALGRL